MYIFLTVIHVILCIFLVIVVLLQSGQAADLAGAFGGMGSQTVFGPRAGTTMLSKATTVAATLFMVTSLCLSIMATRAGHAAPSLLDKTTPHPAAQTTPAPAAPVQPGTVPIQVTPSVDGHQGPTQTVPAPVVPTPNQDQKK